VLISNHCCCNVGPSCDPDNFICRDDPDPADGQNLYFLWWDLHTACSELNGVLVTSQWRTTLGFDEDANEIIDPVGGFTTFNWVNWECGCNYYSRTFGKKDKSPLYLRLSVDETSGSLRVYWRGMVLAEWTNKEGIDFSHRCDQILELTQWDNANLDSQPPNEICLFIEFGTQQSLCHRLCNDATSTDYEMEEMAPAAVWEANFNDLCPFGGCVYIPEGDDCSTVPFGFADICGGSFGWSSTLQQWHAPRPARVVLEWDGIADEAYLVAYVLFDSQMIANSAGTFYSWLRKFPENAVFSGGMYALRNPPCTGDLSLTLAEGSAYPPGTEASYESSWGYCLPACPDDDIVVGGRGICYKMPDTFDITANDEVRDISCTASTGTCSWIWFTAAGATSPTWHLNADTAAGDYQCGEPPATDGTFEFEVRIGTTVLMA
jgi:hypothetical protein